MLQDIDLLLEKLLSFAPEELEKLSGVKASSIATMRTRLKQGTKSISPANLCRLADALGEDPVLALLSLLHDQMTRGKEKLDKPELSELIDKGIRNLAEFRDSSLKQKKATRSCSMTLGDFPYGFRDPFVVVTGDRREVGGKKITPADFGGVLSASPADVRWLFQLGLPKETEVITDKAFALAPLDVLARRFSEVTLICVGSPASNHLARILNRYSLFRFNLPAYLYEQSERLIQDAWEKGAGAPTRKAIGETTERGENDFWTAPREVSNFDYEALGDFLLERDAEIRHLKHAVFSGGFIDPTYPHLVRGLDKSDDRDFGVITVAQNPFRQEGDYGYPAVFFGGYHLPGTCRSLAPSLWSKRTEFFEDHPYGGIIRVDLRPAKEKDYYPFYERMENFEVKWDDDSSYTPQELLQRLMELGQKPTKSCHMQQHEAKRAHTFLNALISKVLQ